MKQTKQPLELVSIAVSSLMLSACAPRYTYQDKVAIVDLMTVRTVKTRVSASVEDWRDSGVRTEKGKAYRVSAKGQWRTYPSCNFTGPDGIGLYKDWCVKSPLFPTIVAGYSHSSLIAKIGESGEPFVVGAEKEFVADNDGVLLFRINDTLNANFDNEGFVDVEIQMGQAVVNKPINQANFVKNTGDASVQADYFEPKHSTGQNNIPIDIVAATLTGRIALVIGNSDYAYSPLKNPVNDARAMASSLKALGFDVEMVLNANQEQMDEAIDYFGRRLLTGNQVGLFYFAGHGVQVDGENYLIPVDAVIKRQSDVRYKAVNIGQIMGAMGDANDNLNIVIVSIKVSHDFSSFMRSAFFCDERFILFP